MPEEPRPVKAELLVDGAAHAVELHLTGHFQPLDGRYHWGGRMTGGSAVSALLRAGRRDVRLRCAPAASVPARLLEVDPWGNVRFCGTGAPPHGAA